MVWLLQREWQLHSIEMWLHQSLLEHRHERQMLALDRRLLVCSVSLSILWVGVGACMCENRAQDQAHPESRVYFCDADGWAVGANGWHTLNLCMSQWKECASIEDKPVTCSKNNEPAFSLRKSSAKLLKCCVLHCLPCPRPLRRGGSPARPGLLTSSMHQAPAHPASNSM